MSGSLFYRGNFFIGVTFLSGSLFYRGHFFIGVTFLSGSFFFGVTIVSG
jgi:hypothetical protein